jgi:GntR family transcriptional regulator
MHERLRRTLAARVESGRWRPGTQLPPEGDLCRRFQCSRITVRHALQRLAAEGLVLKVPGRGTYVAQAPFGHCVLPLMGFTQDTLARGQQPQTRVLHFGVMAAGFRAAGALRIRQGRRIVVLSRVRLASGQPMAVENAQLPESRFPKLADQSIEGRSLYALLDSAYGIRPHRALQRWQAIACPAEQAALLDLAPGTPVLQIERTTFDEAGRPFEYVESFFRNGDRQLFLR